MRYDKVRRALMYGGLGLTVGSCLLLVWAGQHPHNIQALGAALEAGIMGCAAIAASGSRGL